MKKLVRGIVEFRRKRDERHRDTFARLALGQSPDCLFISCSDSRVAVNVFASTDPGDLFVIRNVGNMVPPAASSGISISDVSEAAAIEFALTQLTVTHIIVCGHSECGAMAAAYKGREKVLSPNLRAWLGLAEPALAKLKEARFFAPELAPHNRLSQLNVLEQILHLRTYPAVRERLERGELTLHGWWFDIAKADVYAYEEVSAGFVIIDEQEAERILRKFNDWPSSGWLGTGPRPGLRSWLARLPAWSRFDRRS
ncbi:MAG: carbonic anhydrase [Oligoflexia bacterium]|nr:carbonic anhydrase [Oligoflexia bacterium]